MASVTDEIQYDLYMCPKCGLYQFPSHRDEGAFLRLVDAEDTPIELQLCSESSLTLGVHDCPEGGPDALKRCALVEYPDEREHEFGDDALTSAVVVVKAEGLTTTITTAEVQDKDCARLARRLRAELVKAESGLAIPLRSDEAEEGLTVVVRGRRVAATIETNFSDKALVSVTNLLLGTVVRLERAAAEEPAAEGPKA